jgi:hypothetical protein
MSRTRDNRQLTIITCDPIWHPQFGWPRPAPGSCDTPVAEHSSGCDRPRLSGEP